MTTYCFNCQYEDTGRDLPLPERPPDPKRLRARMVRLLQARGIRDERVLSAMNNVPRHLFVQKALAVQAYEDTPLPIGFGQSISQPYIVALMSSLLKLKPGLRVLEIGTGSGYQAAVLAQLGCTVFTVECVPELYRETGNLLHSLGFRSIYAFFGDGTLGLPDAAPFDRIIITACGPKIPAPLVEQLDKNGILIAPVGSREHQRLTCLHKSGDHPVAREHDAVIFVDLVGIHGRGTDQRAKSLPSEVGRVFL